MIRLAFPLSAASAGGVFRPTGTIVSGASMVTNLVHAAVQPSGVSGHRSSGRDLGPPTVHTP